MNTRSLFSPRHHWVPGNRERVCPGPRWLGCCGQALLLCRPRTHEEVLQVRYCWLYNVFCYTLANEMEFGQGYIGVVLLLGYWLGVGLFVYVLHVCGANYFHISYVISIELVSLYYTVIVFSLNSYNWKDIMSHYYSLPNTGRVRIMWNLKY